MKRNIWGYDKKSADEYIEALEGQIDILNSKLTVLTIELNTANDKLKSFPELPSSPVEIIKSHETLKKRLDELVNEKNNLIEKYEKQLQDKQQEIELLNNEKEKLSAKIAKLENDIQQEKALRENVAGSILVSMSRERAVAEAEKIKKASRDEIMSYVDEYVSTLNQSNENLKKIIKQLRREYKSVTDALSDSIDRFSESLWIMDTYNERIEKGIFPIDDIAFELKTKLDLSFKNAFKSITETQLKRKDLNLFLDISDEKHTELLEKYNLNKIAEPKQETDDVESKPKNMESINNEKIITKDPSKSKLEILKINTNVKSTDIFRSGEIFE